MTEFTAYTDASVPNDPSDNGLYSIGLGSVILKHVDGVIVDEREFTHLLYYRRRETTLAELRGIEAVVDQVLKMGDLYYTKLHIYTDCMNAYSMLTSGKCPKYRHNIVCRVIRKMQMLGRCEIEYIARNCRSEFHHRAHRLSRCAYKGD